MGGLVGWVRALFGGERIWRDVGAGFWNAAGLARVCN